MKRKCCERIIRQIEIIGMWLLDFKTLQQAPYPDELVGKTEKPKSKLRSMMLNFSGITLRTCVCRRNNKRR